MKKIFALLSVIALFAISACSEEFLNTEPTDRVSGPTVFSDAENAMAAINGIYRLMYTGGWGSGWEAENGGLPAYILVCDLKGEDHVMDGAGSGWFYYDYAYDTFGDYKQNAGHQYNMWNFFYTIICNANYVLANKETLEGDVNYVDYVIGQAYAIRSWAYMWLVQSFQQNPFYGVASGKAEDLPGVPLYTEPTVAGSVGKGRGTVADVWKQCNADIDSAIVHLEATSLTQQHKSHIDKYVAYGIKANNALVQHEYATALEFAKKAMAGAEIGAWDDIKTVNSIEKKNVLWGLAIQTDQAISGWDIMYHMDADCESTYSAARHLIGNWLYDQIPATDCRKAWWTAPLAQESWGKPGTKNGSNRSWCQKKIVYINPAASTGDHILMRVEEMYLIAAEAACELNDFTAARGYLKNLGDKRDTGYDARLAAMADSKTLNPNTVAAPLSLMDEVFFQRRVELWSEYPRLFDIQRRGLCFDRDWTGNNHTETCSDYTGKVASANFILWIPQAEFDGNENMKASTDQNPTQGKNK